MYFNWLWCSMTQIHCILQKILVLKTCVSLLGLPVSQTIIEFWKDLRTLQSHNLSLTNFHYLQSILFCGSLIMSKSNQFLHHGLNTGVLPLSVLTKLTHVLGIHFCSLPFPNINDLRHKQLLAPPSASEILLHQLGLCK